MRPVGVAIVAACVLVAGCARTAGPPLEPLPSGGPPTTAPVDERRADNGVADLTGAQIVAKARAAVRKAGTVHLVGYGAADGTLLAIDIWMKGQAGGTGFVKINGYQLDLIRIGPVLYVRGGAEFWRTQGRSAQVARQLATKYLLVRPADEVWDLAGFTDLHEMLGSDLQPTGLVLKGHHKMIRGVDAIGVTADGTGDTMYVALRGEPYPVQIVPRGKDDDYSLNLVDYAKPVKLAAPPPAQIVD